MGVKKLILLLVVLSILMSGCLNSGDNQEQRENDSGAGDSGESSGGTQRYQEEQTPEETITAEETVTSDEIETPVETETFEETDTPEKTETPEEMLTPGGAGGIEEEQTENVTEEEEAETGQSAESEPRTYLVRLREYVFIPSELEINTGDLVVWRNFEDTVFTLTSEEGLFENKRLGYGNTFNYTFNEAGSFNFSASGYPNMRMTITVK